MLNINTINNIVIQFAETNNFLQQKDIDAVENSDFNRKNYTKINNKKYISMNEYKERIEIEIGRIHIEVDTIDEEEWYYIEKSHYFILNVIDFPNEDLLIEAILKECKNVKLL
jgi:hypothetical protein